MTVAQACNEGVITPRCLRTLGTADYVPQVPGKNKVRLTNYLRNTSNIFDVLIFEKIFRPGAASAASTFKTVMVAGGVDRQSQRSPEQLDAGLDLEGNLDAETILGIKQPYTTDHFQYWWQSIFYV
jgi:tripeptidyl-peptidase I